MRLAISCPYGCRTDILRWTTLDGNVPVYVGFTDILVFNGRYKTINPAFTRQGSQVRTLYRPPKKLIESVSWVSDRKLDLQGILKMS